MRGNVLCVQVRSTISDFAVFLTIMIMVLVDYLVGVPTPKLNVPDRFEVTAVSTAVKSFIVTLSGLTFCMCIVYVKGLIIIIIKCALIHVYGSNY